MKKKDKGKINPRIKEIYQNGGMMDGVDIEEKALLNNIIRRIREIGNRYDRKY